MAVSCLILGVRSLFVAGCSWFVCLLYWGNLFGCFCHMSRDSFFGPCFSGDSPLKMWFSAKCALWRLAS